MFRSRVCAQSLSLSIRCGISHTARDVQHVEEVYRRQQTPTHAPGPRYGLKNKNKAYRWGASSALPRASGSSSKLDQFERGAMGALYFRQLVDKRAQMMPYGVTQ